MFFTAKIGLFTKWWKLVFGSVPGDSAESLRLIDELSQLSSSNPPEMNDRKSVALALSIHLCLFRPVLPFAQIPPQKGLLKYEFFRTKIINSCLQTITEGSEFWEKLKSLGNFLFFILKQTKKNQPTTHVTALQNTYIYSTSFSWNNLKFNLFLNLLCWLFSTTT